MAHEMILTIDRGEVGALVLRGPLLKKRKGNALMASAVARAYKGGLGALPPVGSRGKAPGQGVRGASPP
mgnify:CR=1 FL=1